MTTVEIKDVEIPGQMQRAMARQAEAERERRAKIINAEGEFQASERLSEAADVISRNPATLQLRYLQTLGEIGVNQNSTVVFPLPIDLVRPFLEGFDIDDGEAPRPPWAKRRSEPSIAAGDDAAASPASLGAGPPTEGATEPADADLGTPPSPEELPPSRR